MIRTIEGFLDHLLTSTMIDSKQLTENQRDNLFKKIQTSDKIPIGFVVDVLEPEDLSMKMQRT